MGQTTKYSIDGVDVTVERCSHCGAEATEEEVRATLKKEIRTASRCAHCRGPIRWKEIRLAHRAYDQKEPHWSIDSGSREFAVDVTVHGPSPRGFALHLACARRAFPEVVFEVEP